MNSSPVAASTQGAVSESSPLPSVVGAALLGLTILFAVGFMQGKADVVHNAAHDTRHSFTFPCH